MTPVAELISLQEAQALVFARVQPLASEPVALDARCGAGAGRAGERRRRPAAVPELGDGRLRGSLGGHAGNAARRLPHRSRAPRPRPLEAGEAMAIATGGVVPDGADAVIPHEYVVESDNSVEISEPVASGANVRNVGGDVAAGGLVVRAGVRLGPAQIGALAAAGVAEVVCARRRAPPS